MQTNQVRSAPPQDKWIWERQGAATQEAAPATASAPAASASTCRFCGEALPPGGRQCVRCSNEVASVKSSTRPAATPEADATKHVQGGAVYALEFPTRCPQCSNMIGTFRVFRLIRTQVSFTSTLPRKGYVIVCPDCEGLLSTELSGLI